MINKPRICYNAECLRCNEVKKEMVAVGVIIMCDECFKIEFHTDDPVREERDKYLYWVNVHKEEAKIAT